MTKDIRELLYPNTPNRSGHKFYKQRKITLKRNWFCMTCNHIFHVKPQQKLSQLCCPSCSSKLIRWNRDAFKAIIDKKPIEVIKEIFKSMTK